MNRPHAVLLGSLVVLVVAPRAHGYLDPGSGSMFLQLLLGGVAGIAVLAKLFWHKLLGLFGIGPRERDENPPA